MDEVTGREIIEIIQEFGELSGAKYYPIHSNAKLIYAPLITWRYKAENKTIEELIVKAINSFEGNVIWKISQEGKNWVLVPEEVDRFYLENGFNRFNQALAVFANKNPNFGKLSNADLPKLALHIKNTISNNLT